jgi:hypothetical protein
MSDFDISIGAEPEEKNIRVSYHLLADSEYARLEAYVNAVNAVRRGKGAKEIDYKYVLPKIIMRGVDTEMSELPDYLMNKVKKTRKRRNGDAQSSEEEVHPMAQAAE